MLKVFIGFSLIVYIIVFVFVIWVFSGSHINTLITFFNKPSYDRWVSQFDKYGVQPGDTVFLGDSITEFGSWHELFPECNVRNRGISGDNTAGVIGRMDQITRGKPAQVFLLIGTNDLLGGVSQKDIVANIVKIVEILQKDSPDTKVFVQSILPRRARYKEKVETLNSELEAVIAKKATWINLYPLFLDNAGGAINDSLSNDKLHLMAAGYIVWRDAIAHLVNCQRESN